MGVTVPLGAVLPPGVHDPPEGVTEALTKEAMTDPKCAQEPASATSTLPPEQLDLLATVATTEHDTPVGDAHVQLSAQVRLSDPEA